MKNLIPEQNAMTAIILMESFLENEEAYPHVQEYQQDHGIYELRSRFIELAAAIEQVLENDSTMIEDIQSKGDFTAFDFEMVPEVLRQMDPMWEMMARIGFAYDPGVLKISKVGLKHTVAVILESMRNDAVAA